MPPSPRPIAMFAAEPPQEPLPYGRWAEALGEHFLKAIAEIETEETLGDPGEIQWFPDRTWNGRTYVPATCITTEGYELFGYVSFTREHEGAQAETFEAAVDYTDETADANPDWTLDLSDQEIGHWRGPGGAAGDRDAGLGRRPRHQRRGGDHRAGADDDRPVRSGGRPLHARYPSTPTPATTWRSGSTGSAGPSWPRSRSTRTTERATLSGHAPIAQLDRATPS